MKKNNNALISSGNPFLDLEVANAEERFAKVELALQINNLIQQKNLTQTAAAKLLEIDQPKISALSTGRLSGFSLERLFRFLNILGQDITIKITPKIQSKKTAHVNVKVPKIKKPVIKRNNASLETIHIQARKKNK